MNRLDETKLKAQDSVIRSAGRMGAGTFLSRIAGLLREQVFAYFFGASLAADAFQIAFRIPNLLRDLFAEGAMSAALVPTFTRVRKEAGDYAGWLLAKRVFLSLFFFSAMIAIIGALFSESLVMIYANKFQDVPGKFELTVRLTQQMMPFFPFVVLAAAFMSVLNACGHFFIPAFSSALFNLVSTGLGVCLVLCFQRVELGFHPIEGMAIGVVVGGIVQAFSQWPSLRKAGYRWLPARSTDSSMLKDNSLRKMLLMMGPGTIGLAATQMNILINSIFATQLGPGVVSWLNYAFRLMQFPIGIFGVSIANANLAEVSRQRTTLERGESTPQELAETIQKSLRSTFALNFPAAAGLVLMAEPLISTLFEYGSFTAIDRHATAVALQCYAVGLVAYSGVKILVPLFYVFDSTRIAVVSSFLVVGLNASLNFLFATRLGFQGLALATSASVLLNFGYLLFALKKVLLKRQIEFRLMPVIRGMGLHLGLALAMALVGGVIFTWVVIPLMQGPGLEITAFGKVFFRCFRLFLGILLCILVWIGLSKVFRVEESLTIFRIFLSKLKRRIG